jgi:phenylalanyl-tRNA synthetase beta chain
MKFSEQWLREWVDPRIDSEALAARLTMAGLEVDAMTAVAPDFSGVVVGHVQAVTPHPEADRLRVCQVDDGSATPLTIVCGAANVATGMNVPLARVGARLPEGKAIGKARLRGIESFGMLCSARELGLGEGDEGLLALPADAPVGADLRAYLGLDDVAIELGLTPNRGDCLGVAGIAREVGVLCRSEVRTPEIPAVTAAIDERRAIELLAAQACPRYLGRVIRGIDPAAATPLWMQERLRRSGLRSISAVVDVSNYVLLELGQPMHAFDLDRLQGGIRVRHAQPGETLKLLDGQTVTLQPDMLVIADETRALALAGIMGGADSAVGDDTRAVFLECAWFAPAALAGRARRLGLHTDSSHRYERGVDPELPARAIERATRLILDIAGGDAGPVVEAVSVGDLPVRLPVILRAARLERVLGYPVAAAEVSDILARLGMQITAQDHEKWEVVPPSFRFDLAIEADLIEEIARVHGYDAIPVQRPRSALPIAAPDAIAERGRTARALLSARAYQEVITYSFIDAELRRRFDPQREGLALANPISADTAVMRSSLWPGLSQVALHNLNRQHERVRIFEHGAKFVLDGGTLREEPTISGLAAGALWPAQWGVAQRDVDFHDVKGDVEALLSALGGQQRFGFEQAEHPALHPGQCARIVDGQGREVGWIGRLHPRLVQELDLGAHPLVFEISLQALSAAPRPAFRELSRFPAVRRDLALIVDESVSAAAVLACVRAAAGAKLQGLRLYDIYQGKGVDSGKKSLALGLTLQDFSRTLTDAEIGLLIQGVLQALKDGLGVTLRE